MQKVVMKKTLIGKRFGKLTVVEKTDKKYSWYTVYKCKCDCGNFIDVSLRQIGYGTLSCGCTKFKDLTGIQFGSLTLLEKTDKKYYHYAIWKCRCECGAIIETPIHGISYNRIICKHCLDSEKQCKCYGVGYTIHNEQFFFDIEDYDKIKDHHWRLQRGSIHGNVKIDNKIVDTPLWRLILNHNVKNSRVRYKNKNVLDLRKENLELAGD